MPAPTSGGRNGSGPIRVLEIITRFIWVYAFESGLVVVRDEAAWLVPTDYRARFTLLDHDPNDGIHRHHAEARAWGADYDLYEEEGHLRSVGATKIPWAVFDLDLPLEPVPGCRPQRFSR